jgi:hypothetical protein
MAAGPLYITSARTAQKTPLPSVIPLFRVTHPLPRNGRLSGSTVLALIKYAILWIYEAFIIGGPNLESGCSTATNCKNKIHVVNKSSSRLVSAKETRILRELFMGRLPAYLHNLGPTGKPGLLFCLASISPPVGQMRPYQSLRYLRHRLRSN